MAESNPVPDVDGIQGCERRNMTVECLWELTPCILVEVGLSTGEKRLQIRRKPSGFHPPTSIGLREDHNSPPNYSKRLGFSIGRRNG